MSQYPLLRHEHHEQPIAWRNGEAVSVARFLREIRQLAEILPQRRHVLNLCTDRYRFLTLFCAALLRGQTNLLPPNHAENTLQRLHASHPDAYGMSDKPLTVPGLDLMPFPDLPCEDTLATDVPAIEGSHVAAIAFTSGSTGEPQAHPKTWASLVRQAQLQAAGLGLAAGVNILGTVPPQHMYGLESTLMMTLHNGGALHAGQPLFPADIRRALEELPVPRVLVTTPLHLRICLEEPNALPPLALILSAAAPLSVELAQHAEQCFDAPVKEIYGCTEAGAIACRRTVLGADWETLAGIAIHNDEDGQAWATGGHLESPVPLQDVIETGTGGDRFRLLGRKADQVKIAGKRASLGDLNRQLNQIPGVRDGVFFAPDGQAGMAPRLIALVVAPELRESEILAALRHRIDPAFLPRPLYLIDALPRTTTGKLPRDTVARMLEELQHA